ncbi:MAG: hypothetical protein RLZZ126_1256 [Pseudomonadota bacterium]
MNARSHALFGVATSQWAPRLWAFVLSALATGSVVFWVLQWPPSAAGLPASGRVAGHTSIAANPQAVARLLGAGTSPQAAPVSGAKVPLPASLLATRMTLKGVVGTPGQAGLALIAIDGKPARSFAVGSRVEGELFLQSVSKTQAMLGAGPDSPALVTLELPMRK